jgi:hypothetical protein
MSVAFIRPVTRPSITGGTMIVAGTAVVQECFLFLLSLPGYV